MKQTQRPIRTTIFLGFICGISFIPLNTGLSYIIPWAKAFNIILWLYLAVYGLFLMRWGGKNLSSIIFPLLLLLISVFVVKSNSAFLLLALGILCWIRSGICFQKPLSRALSAEIFLTFGGAVLVAWFTPHSVHTWALGILMFFLVQSLYFVIFEEQGIKEKVTVDPFEEALLRAEKILSMRF